MNLVLLASAALALFIPQKAAVHVNVDASNAQTLSGTHTFRVTVDSSVAKQAPVINQVEFYVNDDLRDTETSTPYLFPFDTIAEQDGDTKVRFKAYTTDGQTAETSLTVKIDNQRSQGAPFHVKASQDALTDSKWQDALDHGRIALKIDPQNNDARIALSRAYLGLKTYDKAQKYAEDAVAQDPKSSEALKLLAGIDIQRAFSTITKEGGDQSEVVASIGDAFKGAVDAERKSLDLEVDAIGSPDGDKLIPYTDALLRADRYSLAISTLEPFVQKDPVNIPDVNRLAYAEIKAGRYPDAFQTLKDAQTEGGKLSAYSYALLALAYIQLNDDNNSEAAMKTAIESDPDDLGVRSVQTFIALKRNRTDVFSQLTVDLGKDEGQRPEVSYFLMSMADRQQKLMDARKYFERAVLAEPAFVEDYVEQANYNIGRALMPSVTEDEKTADLNQAKMYFQTALVARPEACDALAGLSVIAMLQKNVTDAVSYGEAARDSAPEEALGHYVASGAYESAGRLVEAKTESDKAGKLDKTNLEGREIPYPLAIWRYLVAGGREAVMTPPR